MCCLPPDDVGNETYKHFVKERSVHGSPDYFAPIKILIDTGLRKKKIATLYNVIPY